MIKKELKPINDSAKSFYKKAYVVDVGDELHLKSYDTLVAKIYTVYNKRHLVVYDTFSKTTLRHIKEFGKQHDFKMLNKTQIENDYLDPRA